MSPSKRFDFERSDTIRTRYLILSEGRSGSTLLVHELRRRWPEIRSRGEVFSTRVGRVLSFEQIVEETYFRDTGQAIVGCKVIDGHLDGEQLNRLLDLDDMKVIILRRRDLLRRYVSSMIARQTMEWTAQRVHETAPIEDRLITVNTEHFYNRTVRSLAFWNFCDELERLSTSMNVWYEDISEDLEGELGRVADFLGAGDPMTDSPPALDKQNAESLYELVTNVDEVVEFIHTSGLARFMDFEIGDRGMETGEQSSSEWFTIHQRRLLNIAFGPDDVVDLEWNRGLVDRGEAQRDLGILAPIVHRRTRHLDSDADAAVLIRRLNADAVSHRIRLLDQLGEVLAGFERTGIDALAVDETAIHIVHGDDVRVTSISELAFVISDDRLAEACVVADAFGWRRLGVENGTPSAVDRSSSVDLRLARDDLRLRFRRRLLSDSKVAGFEAEIAERSRSMTFDGHRVRVPSEGDQLLCTLARGVRSRRQRDVRWILDSHSIVTNAGDEIDWVEILSMADRFDVLVRVELALEILYHVLPAVVPDPATIGVRH